MKRPSRWFLILIPTAFLLLSSCDSTSNDYFFEKPSSISILKNVQCTNGSVSYIGLVTDNTDKYGARLMKISGCALKIDKNFDDAIDGKTGLYIGGTGVSSDSMEISGETFIAVASSGYTEFENWKGKDESKKYENHKGRIVFRKLSRDLKHDPVYNKSVLLGFYPSIVKAFNKKGFFVAGSNFGENYIGFIDLDGNSLFNKVDFAVSAINTAGSKAYLFNNSNGFVYSVNELLETELIIENVPDPLIVNRGMVEISKNRFAVFSGKNVVIYNSSLQQTGQIVLPEGYLVSSLSSAEYPVNYEYRKFTDEDMNEKVSIFVKKEESDSDSDTDSDSAEVSDSSDDSDGSGLNDSDGEVSDDDADQTASVNDAKDGDVVWIATTTGSVMAYDLSAQSWLVTSYSESDAASNAAYTNEMRPYINSSYSSFPKYGKTDADNIPAITKVSAIRGLPFSVIYRFTYEGTIEGSYSEKGVMNNEGTVLKDLTADFQRMVDISTDSVVLLNKDNSSACPIPWNENVIMGITELISSNEIGVKIDKYADLIEKCYGTKLSYALFPGSMYSVTKNDNSGSLFAGRCAEYRSDYEGDDFSFEDSVISATIKKTIDDVITEKETSFFIKINPGVPFVGFSSADIMNFMFNAVPGRLVMFSPLTRRIVEYDILNNDIIEVYK